MGIRRRTIAPGRAAAVRSVEVHRTARSARVAAVAPAAVVLAVVVIGVLGALLGPSSGAAAGLRAAPGEDAPVAIVEPGSGWTELPEGRADGLLTVRVFEHAAGRLDLTSLPPPPGALDVTSFIRQMVIQPAGLAEIEVPVPGAVAFGGAGLEEQVHLLAFPDRAGVFVFQLTSSPDPPWEPMELLVDLAERQIAQDGGPAAPGVSSPVPERLVPYLAENPPPELPNVARLGDVGGLEDVGAEVGGSAEVAAYLSDHTESAVRLWRDGSSGVVYGVSVTRFPFPQFAAVAAATYLEHGYERISVPGLAAWNDVVAFRGSGARAGVLGAAFRRGDVSVVVLAGQGTDPSAVEAALVAATRQHLAIAPGGESRQTTLPSPEESVLRSSLLVGVAGIGLLGARRVRVARKVSHREMVDPGPGATVVDVDPAAARSRRAALLLALVQVAGWVVTIVGVAADAPLWVRCALVGAGAGGGVLVTRWWNRRELARVGQVLPRWRTGRRARHGVLVLLGGVALLIGGLAGVVWGVRELLFLPSLGHLRIAERTSIDPRLLALAISGAGAVVALAGTAVLRAGRARARADAAEARQADRRPPVLYLRSFDDDHLDLPSVLSTRRPFTELFTLRTSDPFEEGIAWELATYGPVTAVARPGHDLDTLGAAREHLPTETWQVEVAERMAGARAIVIVPGTTLGLQWEIGEVVSGGHLPKTIFVMPPVAPEELRTRWATACDALPAPIQSIATGLRLDSALTIQLVGDRAVVTVGERRDEAGYRAAVDAAMTEPASHAVTAS